MPDRVAGLLGLASIAVGGIVFLLLLCAAVVSAREQEPRAARRFLAIALAVSLPYVAAGIVSIEFQVSFPTVILLLLALLAAVLIVIPVGARVSGSSATPTVRLDERDTMFSRRTLEPGTARFNEYYRANPDKRKADDEFRALPGLLREGSTQYDPFSFAAADATFATVESLHDLVEGEPAARTVVCDPNDVTKFVRGWAMKLGAVSVGVTELRDYHKYSVIGRGSHYGDPVKLEHKFAIAITVEMDKEMVNSAPMGPIVMESARQYLRSGSIAVQIAEFIRSLGYPARAHIDANYRVVCPLVAWDAGLGELGRMGLLMTPKLGPRVRIGVVTTDLPLVANGIRRDHTVHDFCLHCRKCAEVCPSRAIPFGDREEIDGVRRWRIDSEACFTLWCKMGTDCGRCVSVCPYSHPDNLLHNLVRVGVRRSSLLRRLATRLDDVLYGCRPPPSPLPKWLDIKVDRSIRS